MDGKGRGDTYNFFSRRLGAAGGQGIGHRGSFPRLPRWRRPCDSYIIKITWCIESSAICTRNLYVRWFVKRMPFVDLLLVNLGVFVQLSCRSPWWCAIATLSKPEPPRRIQSAIPQHKRVVDPTLHDNQANACIRGMRRRHWMCEHKAASPYCRAIWCEQRMRQNEAKKILCQRSSHTVQFRAQ